MLVIPEFELVPDVRIDNNSNIINPGVIRSHESADPDGLTVRISEGLILSCVNQQR